MADNEQEDAIKAAAEQADANDGEEQTGEIAPEVGIEALKIQLENERKARFEAEQRAHKATSVAQQSHVEVQDSNLHLVTTAIETVKRDNAMNRSAYAAALAAQDFEKAAEINDVISMNNAKLLQLENGKAELQRRAEEARKAPALEAPVADPVEAVASQLSPRSAEWIRRHPECVRNTKTYTKMIGLHNVAVADGLKPDSDEYFDYIEENLGYKKPPQRQQDVQQDEDPQSTAAKPMARKPQAPAAPPSRGGSNGRTMTLTPAQREAAAISGISEEEYANNLRREKARAH